MDTQECGVYACMRVCVYVCVCLSVICHLFLHFYYSLIGLCLSIAVFLFLIFSPLHFFLFSLSSPHFLKLYYYYYVSLNF
jgi:hypothetical protein